MNEHGLSYVLTVILVMFRESICGLPLVDYSYISPIASFPPPTPNKTNCTHKNITKLMSLFNVEKLLNNPQRHNSNNNLPPPPARTDFPVVNILSASQKIIIYGV